MSEINNGKYPIITRMASRDDVLRVLVVQPGGSDGFVIKMDSPRDGRPGYVRFGYGDQVCERLKRRGATLFCLPEDLERTVMREWLAERGMRADREAVTAALAESAA